MSDDASGANVTRLFNPDREVHYALSQEDEWALRELFDALGVVGMLAEAVEGDTRIEVDAHSLAPVFRSFSRHGQVILARSQSIKPQRKSA